MTLLPQTVEAVAIQRASLIQAGFHYVEVANARLGDQDSGKNPVRDGWHITVPTGPPTTWALNTGIRCNGLRAIDLDIDNPTLASRCQDIAEELLGVTLRRFRAGSARCLLLYRAIDGEPHKITLAGRSHDSKTPGRACKIEVLGWGNQFVAFGTHWEHGATLQWEPHPPGVEVRDDLIAVTEADIASFLQRCAPIIEAKWESRSNGVDPDPDSDHVANPELQADDPLRVARALEGIPNGAPADWEAWNRIGMAVWTATGGSRFGWELFNAWSARNPSYSVEQCRERWTHYPKSPPTRIGAGTLFYLENLAWQEGEVPGPGRPGPAPGPAQDFTATPLNWAAMEAVGPRQWVYGNFLIRKFVSVLGAPGGTGKTAYGYAIALAVATGRVLLGEPVHEAGPVWLYNLEDPMDELLRRMRAAAIHHKVAEADLRDRMFLDSGRDRPLVIARQVSRDVVVADPVVPALIDELKRRGIKLFVVDPFVRSHRVIENANEHIDFAAAQWGQVADQADCAVLLAHHFRKGGVSGDADAFRGASALVDAVRAAVSLATMSEEEAGSLGIADNERRYFIRADNAKLNLAPPPDTAVWLRLRSVILPNGSPLGRPADNVQTVERWEPPSAWEGMPMAIVLRIMDLIAAGLGEGRQFSLKRGNHDHWAGSIIMTQAGKTDKQAAALLRSWCDSGLLQPDSYIEPKSRKLRDGLKVDETKIREMRQSITPGEKWGDSEN